MRSNAEISPISTSQSYQAHYHNQRKKTMLIDMSQLFISWKVLFKILFFLWKVEMKSTFQISTFQPPIFTFQQKEHILKKESWTHSSKKKIIETKVLKKVSQVIYFHQFIPSASYPQNQSANPHLCNHLYTLWRQPVLLHLLRIVTQ